MENSDEALHFRDDKGNMPIHLAAMKKNHLFTRVSFQSSVHK